MKIWHAPAKLNLFLHVVGQYDNGYHELQTVYQFIDWKDELSFEVTQDGKIHRISLIEGIPESQCLTVKAAKALRRRHPGAQGVNIQLTKNIPVGSGLGGGSSDAATTLKALNELWKLNLSKDDLAEIGAEVGADIPVFIYEKNAWAEGKGEILSDISIPRSLYAVVIPTVEVSTQRVFQESVFSSFHPRITVQEYLNGSAVNDLEQAACRLYPQVKSTLQWLENHGKARMTGSGGAVFLAIDTEQQGRKILERLPPGCQGKICIGNGS